MRCLSLASVVCVAGAIATVPPAIAIALEGEKISIINVFFVGSQYDSLRSPLSQVINNYEVNEWVNIP